MIVVGNLETTQLIDESIKSKYDISEDILIENVAFKLIENIDLSYDSYLVIAGFGNNGSDGYALARLLYSKDKKVSIFKIENDFYSKACLVNYERAKKLGIDFISNLDNLHKYDVIIDAIFGVGLNRDITEPILSHIDKINDFGALVYSLDIPSGLDANKGLIFKNCVKADITLSIMSYKQGFLNYDSKEYTGNIQMINDVVLKKEELNEYSNIHLIEHQDILNMQKARKENTNKTDYGKTFIVAGSKTYLGAALLTSKASVNSGSGYTYLLSDYEELLEAVYKIPELIFTRRVGDLDSATTIAIGPGMIYGEFVEEVVSKYKSTKSMVIDAGALSDKLDLKNSKDVIITPHTGEFARMANIPLESILESPITHILDYARDNKVNVLLKGKNTYITDGNDVYVVNTGNAYMANGGMGDVLTGMIASFISQGYSTIKAAIIAAYLHGYIADKLKEEGLYIVNPTDILDNIKRYMFK